jgi:hypothetical protein
MSTSTTTFDDDLSHRVLGIGWGDVDLTVIQRFLAAAGDESTLWEAKGTKARPEQIRIAVAGMANGSGGFVLLGVERDGDSVWHASGLAFPHREPATWVSGVLAEQINPIPDFAVHIFDADADRAVAVVLVRPFLRQPGMVNGKYFIRRDGATMPLRHVADVDELREFIRQRTAVLPSAPTGVLPPAPTRAPGALGELQDRLDKQQVVLIVGGGVSRATLPHWSEASWRGLLEHAIRFCV